MKNLLLFAAALLVLVTSCNKTKKPEMSAKETTLPKELVQLPEWAKNAVIYEINVRQFSNEGTFKAVEKDLPRLKSLGVDILWLMPIHPISKLKRKGGLGSHYAVGDYLKTNPDYGTMDDFKSLVKSAHANGLKIILDWVPNHTGWDNPWITEHPDWYTHVNDTITDPLDEKGKSVGWIDVADLNYGNRHMRKGMIDALNFWVKEAGIDGYRMDVAGFVPDDFWTECINDLKTGKPDIFMLAEWEKPEHFAVGFHACYGWAFHSLIKEVYKGNKTTADIDKHLAHERDTTRGGYSRMNFTNNHDENSWNGTTKELFAHDTARGDAQLCFAVLAATIDGIPMIYNGLESKLNHRLRFFEKDTINWGKYELTDFYQKLFKLKHENVAMFNGGYGSPSRSIANAGEGIYAYIREKDGNQVVIVLNLSPKAAKVNVKDAAIKGEFTELFSGKKEKGEGGLASFDLEAWGYKVFHN